MYDRERRFNTCNFKYYDAERIAGKFGIPLLKKCDFIPQKLIGFNYVKTTKEYENGVHFFLDDYQFERIWNRPVENIERLKKFSCVLTPDFSLYTDMPMAMQIWNVYRSRLIGQIMQDEGMRVIPTISWSEESSYEFAFDGIESGSTIALSTVGIVRDKKKRELFLRGIKAAIDAINPSAIVLYGKKIKFDFDGKVQHIPSREYGKDG